MNFKEFNDLFEQVANNALKKCCVSESWVNGLIKNIPFSSPDELIKNAANCWYDNCTENDWKEAFNGHPKIGNVDSLKQKFAPTKDWANKEQIKVGEADDKILETLSKLNDKYLSKFGYIFIVSATGKSAKEIVDIIQIRLLNSKEDELNIAMGEQHKITMIRLAKLIDDLGATADLRSHITTHVLDTSTGIPAKGMPIKLEGFTDGSWKPIAIGITNNDGRIADLLAPGKLLTSGNYQMTFSTEPYYKSKDQNGFYPQVNIQFKVSDHDHYHVPLLINPYGYTTYKGS
jgi:5-hydroxyisourate hydrolase / 2-oxo-4-hydroxy-4-carboxy-5-ureidoimidazoline decarboxylase